MRFTVQKDVYARMDIIKLVVFVPDAHTKKSTTLLTNNANARQVMKMFMEIVDQSAH